MKFLQVTKKDIILVFIIIFVALWRYVITPSILSIPRDFNFSAKVISVDNFYDAERKVFNGDQYSKTEFSYKVLTKNKNNLVVKNLFDVRTLDGEQIVKIERLYGIDAVSGKHVLGFGDKERQGSLFAPKNLKKGQPFAYWHVNYDGPANMKFVDVEKFYGLELYKYETYYEGVKIDQTKDLTFLPGVGKSLGVELEPHLQLWVEPITGRLVKYQDETTAYFYDLGTRERIYPWNKFSNTFSEESVVENVNLVQNLKYKFIFISYIIPIALFLIALILVLIKFNFLFKFFIQIRKNLSALLVIFIFVPGTLFSYYIANERSVTKTQRLLDNETQLITSLIQRRMDIYFNSLRSGKALLEAMPEVNRSNWNQFINTLNISKNGPGFLDIGFAKEVQFIDKQDYIKNIQNEGYEDFKILPLGNRPLYVPISFFEPMTEENKKTFGFDMFFDEKIKNAIIRAKDTKKPTITSKIQLTQDIGKEEKPGFIAFLPVELNSNHKNITRSNKDDNIYGYVYSSFRVKDLIKGIVGEKKFDVDFHIYDGLKMGNDSFMYDFRNNSSVSELHNNIVYKKVVVEYLEVHPWTFEFINSPDFKVNFIDRALPLAVLFGGLFISFLVIIVIRSFSSSKEDAVEYGKKITKELEKSKENLEIQNMSLQDKIEELDKLNRLTINRELKMIDLKKEIAELSKKKGGSDVVE
jgi:CHASE1-domain containing sensor protein